MNVTQKENISLWQLFILMMVFTMGTAVVVGTGEEAKQDVWLADLIATGIGICLVWGYYHLVSRANGKNIYEIIYFTLGKIVGPLLSLGYVNYFLYLVTRNIRDFGELMKVTIMPLTPIEVITITMLLVIVYILYLGLEVLVRVTEILSPYLIAFILLIGLFLLFSGAIEVKNLQPVLAEGIQPVLGAVFPLGVVFPFGELVAFTVIMTATTRFNYIGKVSVISVLLSGLLIMYASLIQILTLGTDVKTRSLFPLIVAAREIAFERVDILVMFIVLIAILIKASVFFYAGLKGLEHVFNVPYRLFIIPISMMLSLFSTINARNIVEHFEEGLEIVPYYVHLPFQIGIPFVLFLILLIKRKKKS